MSMRERPSSRPRRSRRGFTMVEVLATITLMGITLPVMMNGIIVAGRTAVVARHRNEAAALAESQLTEIVASGQWQLGQANAGGFTNTPDYHWRSTVESWTQSGLDQIDLYVTWNDRGDREIMVSTLVYDGSNAGNGTAGNATPTGSGSGSGSKSGSGSGSSGSGSGSSGSTGSGGAK